MELESNHAISSLFSNKPSILASPPPGNVHQASPSPTSSSSVMRAYTVTSSPGLTFSNELIFRDEGPHCDFVCILYNLLCVKLDKSRIDDIEIEHEFPRPMHPTPIDLLRATGEEHHHAS
jgi:hypothetical protein